MQSPIKSKALIREYLKDCQNEVGTEIIDVIKNTFE